MKNKTKYLLVILSFILLFFEALFAYFVVGIGTLEYRLSIFHPPFIKIYITLIITIGFFIYSVLLLLFDLKMNKNVGYYFIAFSVILLFYGIIDYIKIGLEAWLRMVYYFLLSLTIFLIGYIKIK